ncbi:uncharacterized protein LOC127040136 isoform X1 [Gopherus flavomarginatus]|uniref:uncharacterized protein LOC127040136 isoform X1 n=1 Tax=Gopherus flavomarginatus TaxID=286002 RepID=UPI0021CBBBEB|nr:uncharacterized protein LOC127040136 isoform X1 [Gopherus flavomarginatus]
MLSSQPRSAPVAAAKAQIKKQLDWASQDLGAAAGTAGKGSAPTRPRCWLAHFLQWAQPAGADSMVQRDPGSCSISHAASAKSPERWSGGGGDSPHSRDWITSGPCVCDEPRSPSSPPLCYCTNHEPTPPSQLGGELRPLQPLSLLDLVLGAPAKLLPGRWCPLPWVHLISVTRIPVNLRPAWCLQQSRLHVPRLVRWLLGQSRAGGDNLWHVCQRWHVSWFSVALALPRSWPPVREALHLNLILNEAS